MADTERARGWLSSVDLLSRRLSVSCFELLGLYLAICKAAFYSTIWLYTFETSVRERERERRREREREREFSGSDRGCANVDTTLFFFRLRYNMPKSKRNKVGA